MADTAQPFLEYETQWGLLTRLVGQPLISQWSSGAPVTHAEVLPDEKETSLRQAATVRWPDDAIKTSTALTTKIRIFAEHGGHLHGDPLLIAARHRTEGYPLPRMQSLMAAAWLNDQPAETAT
ncbi:MULTISPECIES: hypothetical protein [Streptomyces]|uniref:hypothetical protein n=1 Tax=Streptomyces TaxID=1883 RepID=UPI001EFE7E6D|nr:hypothetical protein [Streptomyces sp. CBG31]